MTFPKATLIAYCILCLLGCNEKDSYSASDCIVRVNLQWDGETTEEKIEYLEKFSNVYLMAPEKAFNKVPPSMAVQGSEMEYIYFQHKLDCDERIANTKYLLDYVKSNLSGSPLMTVDEGRFDPSPRTIRAEGEWWD